MKLNGKVKCPGCGLSTELKGFKKPHVIQPTITHFRCSTCESEVMVKFSKPKGVNDPTQLMVQAKITRPSKALIDMLAEEAAMKDKPVEEETA